MKENEILTEIRAVREDLARRCNFDLSAMIKHLRKGEMEAETAGRKLVSLAKSQEFRSESTRVKEEPKGD